MVYYIGLEKIIKFCVNKLLKVSIGHANILLDVTTLYARQHAALNAIHFTALSCCHIISSGHFSTLSEDDQTLLQMEIA